MHPDKNLLQKGVKYAVGSMPLMFLGPMTIYNALINRHSWVHYIVLTVGIFICGLSVFLMWKGIQLILKSLFNEK